MKTIYIGAGCFWGTQAYYQKIKGVISSQAGYANGNTSNPSYEEVCSNSGHVEVVKIVYDSKKISNEEVFKSYIRIINPYTSDRQGNDVGVQYRPGLYFKDLDLMEQFKLILKSWEKENSKSAIEVLPISNYAIAEENHQDYLDKNPNGYCHISLLNIPEKLLK